MPIITPDTITDVAWEGALTPRGETLMGSSDAVASIGKPVHWDMNALEKMTDKKWAQPSDGHVYTLVRLACTLHPPSGKFERYRQAKFSVYLRPYKGDTEALAYDLMPQQKNVEDSRTYNAVLSPEFNFMGGSLKAGEIGVEIEHKNAFAIIKAFGIGEPSPYWQFSYHDQAPLEGAQSVYLVVSTPQQSMGIRLGLALEVMVETHFGPLPNPLQTPRAAHTSLSHAIRFTKK